MHLLCGCWLTCCRCLQHSGWCPSRLPLPLGLLLYTLDPDVPCRLPRHACWQAFLDAFSWELWVAMVLTPIAVAICLFAIERWAPDARPGGGGAFTEIAHQDFQSITWAAVGRPMQVSCINGHQSSYYPASTGGGKCRRLRLV